MFDRRIHIQSAPLPRISGVYQTTWDIFPFSPWPAVTKRLISPTDSSECRTVIPPSAPPVLIGPRSRACRIRTPHRTYRTVSGHPGYDAIDSVRLTAVIFCQPPADSGRGRVLLCPPRLVSRHCYPKPSPHEPAFLSCHFAVPGEFLSSPLLNQAPVSRVALRLPASCRVAQPADGRPARSPQIAGLSWGMTTLHFSSRRRDVEQRDQPCRNIPGFLSGT